MSHNAEYDLNAGNEFPYDGPVESSVKPDWALRAARGIFNDLNDRCGIKDGFKDVDISARQDIVAAAADIIRLAASNAQVMPESGTTVNIVYKDSEFKFSSSGDSVTILGMLDVARQQVIGGMS